MSSNPTTHDILNRTSDVVDLYGDECQIVEPGQMRSFGGLDAFQGEVETVLAPEDNVIMKQVLSEQGNGRILVVDALGSRRVGVLGGNVASMALRNGWAGCVVYGCVRDVMELRTMQFGVYAIAPCPRKSLKHGHGQRGIPIAMFGVSIHRGNYMCVDDDGIVILPQRNPLL